MTAIVRGEISWVDDKKFKGMAPEVYALVRDALGKPRSLPEDQSEASYMHGDVVVASDDVGWLYDLGIHITVKHFKNMLRETSTRPGVSPNLHIHVGGLSLMAITQVEVLEDCCTEELQTKLEKGWRILAICPQLTQRRPDYIMGRDHEE